MNRHFATSQRNDMRPLAFQGIFATDCYEQLRNFLETNEKYLAQKGMPDARNFLAEPMHDPTGTIDWYVAGEGTPVPLSSLGEDEKARVVQTLGKYAKAMQGLLEPRPGEEPTMAQGLMREALQHPSESDIHVLDGKPVLMNWGFSSGVQGAVPQDIMRLGERVEPSRPQPDARQTRPTPPTPPTPPTAAPAEEPPAKKPGCLVGGAAGCFPWLLPLLLALLLLWLLLAALGLLASPLPAGCFRVPLPDSAEALRAKDLDDEEARLLALLRERAAMCKPAEEPEPELHAETPPVIPDFSEPAVEPEPEPEPEEPVEQPFFGEAPVIEPEPEPAPVVKPEPKPEPKPKPRSSTMEIPRDAAKNNDLSFLEGCWRSRTDLFNTRGEPIEGEYCFNKNGSGRRFIYERNGQRCSGAARARFKGNQLVIEAPEASCPRGGGYVAQDVTCTGTESQTQCNGKEHSRDRTTWKATFLRK